VVHASSRAGRRLLVLLLASTLVAAACGGGDDSDGGGSEAGEEPGEEESGTPQAGGQVIYGVEAENSGGWCLAEAQLAISGIMVARTIYDTLTAPNSEGEPVPYLAESVEPNETFDMWTVTLREGVKFHDGTDLTAEVVKNNLDAYRGVYPARSPLLFVFVFDNIASVDVVDPLTLNITTKTPWPALPDYLFSSGRLGIMGQAQLDSPDGCETDLIGTGPFMLEDWVVNDHLTAVRNPDYWRQDENGTQLPYLDEITFRPIIESAQRVTALQAGEINAMHESGGLQIEQLRQLAESGTIENNESDQFSEVTYGMLNTSKPPFDNILARQAMAHAVDRERINQLRNNGIFELASGPFAPGNMGYLADTGYPEYDPEEAQRLVDEYESSTGQELAFTLSSTTDPGTFARAQLLKEMAEAVGATVTLRQSEQAQLINEAIAADFQAVLWRLHEGGDPDGQYIWWREGSPVNFSRIADPEINRLLDEGRTTIDEAARQQIYEDLNRRFAEQLYNLWQEWPIWTIATLPEVNGVFGPPLPDGSEPFPGLASGHPTVGLWIEQG
jgi:peptide/nickel transport system substrate-binding protein